MINKSVNKKKLFDFSSVYFDIITRPLKYPPSYQRRSTIDSRVRVSLEVCLGWLDGLKPVGASNDYT